MKDVERQNAERNKKEKEEMRIKEDARRNDGFPKFSENIKASH